MEKIFEFISEFINGEKQKIINPISLMMIKSCDTPSDAVRVKFLLDKNINEILHLSIKYNGKEVFYGKCDKQIFEISSQGGFLTLEARSIASLLMDNEAVPGDYYDVGLDYLFDRYVGKYGLFINNIGFGDIRRNVYIGKGKSEWGAFCHCCKMFTGQVPYISGNNTISLYPNNKNVFIDKDILKISMICDRSCIISKVILKDEDGLYTNVYHNQNTLSAGVVRKKYYYQPKEWQNSNRYSAIKEMENSLKNKNLVVVTVKGFFEIEVGDMIEYRLDNTLQSNLVVREVKVNARENQIITEITACPKEYF